MYSNKAFMYYTNNFQEMSYKYLINNKFYLNFESCQHRNFNFCITFDNPAIYK